MGVAVLVSPGCGGGGDKERETAFEPVPDELIDDPRFGVYPADRVDAVLGMPMVILVELAGGYLPEDIGAVRLDDGRELESEVVWFGVSAQPASGQWLDPAGVWRVRTLDEVLESGRPSAESGTWAILLDPPIDAVGQGLWIAGRRHTVNWLPDTSVVASRATSRAWASPVPREMRRSARLRFLVEPLGQNPLSRWRLRLLMGELSPKAERRVVDLDGRIRRPERGAVSEDRFGHEALERLARQRESLWAIALARLDQADDALAARVRERLVAVVDFGAGEVAPFWTVDENDLRVLLADMLDQRLSTRERSRRARVWLESQPDSLAWVVSDAPRSDALTGEPVSTVAIANASGASVLTSVRAARERTGSELSPLAAFRARAYEVPVVTTGTDLPRVWTSVGESERVLSVPGALLEVEPPGLRIERFFGDWSLRTLWAQAGPPAPGGESSLCGALLYKDPLGRWMLYVECQSLPGQVAGERLRLTFGPEGGAGSRVLEFTPETEPEDSVVDVGRFPGGWFVRAVVPAESIEREAGVLRLGLERFDALGRRSTWPRPMLPWQGEAPRALIDLSAWDKAGR